MLFFVRVDCRFAYVVEWDEFIAVGHEILAGNDLFAKIFPEEGFVDLYPQQFKNMAA